MGSPEWVIWNVTGHTLLWLTRATCSWWWIWSNKVIKVDYRWSKYDYYLHIEGLFFGCLSFTSAPLLLMTFFQQFVKFNHPREEALSQADPFPLSYSSQDHLRKGKSFHHSGQEWVSSLFGMQSMNPVSCDMIQRPRSSIIPKRGQGQSYEWVTVAEKGQGEEYWHRIPYLCHHHRSSRLLQLHLHRIVIWQWHGGKS